VAIPVAISVAISTGLPPSLIATGAALALDLAVMPCLCGLFGHHTVVEQAIRRTRPSAHGLGLDRCPSGQVAPIACKGGKLAVVVGQAGRWDAMPGGTPEQDSSAELVAGGDCC
jgi:hypothetical protein